MRARVLRPARNSMTADDEVFNGEMERAHSRRATMEVYWTGYAAGLMRARFGSVAVRDQFHDELRQGDPTDERARGYRDGYAKLERLARDSSEPDVAGDLRCAHHSTRKNEVAAFSRRPST
jgi:hypothetical protein